jgi:hypothetical protein
MVVMRRTFRCRDVPGQTWCRVSPEQEWSAETEEKDEFNEFMISTVLPTPPG